MVVNFFSVHLDEHYNGLRRTLLTSIKKLSNDEISASDPAELARTLAAQYNMKDIPTLNFAEREMDEPKFTLGSEQANVTFYVPFVGNPDIFRFRHSMAPLPPPTYEVNDGFIIKQYSIQKDRISSVDAQVKRDMDLVEEFLVPLRRMIPLYNEPFFEIASSEIQKRLKEIGDNAKASEDLSKLQIRVRKRVDGSEKTIVPVQRKQLPVPSQAVAPSVREFLLGMAEYEDILATITSMVKVMERTPEVFARMDEEPLRTILLVALNGIYQGQATGETFNGHGKMDILIRKNDKNVFIAECLMWKGPKYLLSKMDEQLFQYGVWRDSKLALIVFNRGVEFTHTIKTMKETVKAHPQCVKELNYPHESGARYEFRRHDDVDKHFILTALAFNVPE